jgi:hypothetical protein
VRAACKNHVALFCRWCETAWRAGHRFSRSLPAAISEQRPFVNDPGDRRVRWSTVDDHRDVTTARCGARIRSAVRWSSPVCTKRFGLPASQAPSAVGVYSTVTSRRRIDRARLAARCWSRSARRFRPHRPCVAMPPTAAVARLRAEAAVRPADLGTKVRGRSCGPTAVLDHRIQRARSTPPKTPLRVPTCGTNGWRACRIAVGEGVACSVGIKPFV